MITLRPSSFRHMVAKLAIFVAAIVLADSANAQRPSVADMQAQIDAVTYPYDEPAAQVRTALDILPTFQEAVVRAYRVTGEAPVNRGEAGLTYLPTDTSTSFIIAVEVDNGSIVFTFGNDADASLTGETLIFTPYETEDSTIVWRCGNDAISPSYLQLLGQDGPGNPATYVASTIPATAHPAPCILKSFVDSRALIRAQVETALDIVPAFQDAVVDYFRQTGAVPVDRQEAGLIWNSTATGTNFIEEVEIINGSISVRFGNEADDEIHGDTLVFTPYETGDMTVVWQCGFAPQPPNTSLLGTLGGLNAATYQPSTVLPILQPRPCITKAYAASNDTIRAQVLEPFDVVEKFKDAIEAAGAALGSPSQPRPPIDRSEAGLSTDPTDTVGRYFSRVDVVNGTIVVTYDASETHAFIRGDTMTWTPFESPDGTIVWSCGHAPLPANTELMGSADGGVIAYFGVPTMFSKYLPSDCRP